VSVPHDCLASGDLCPACKEAKLTETTPAVAYRWTGQTPILLTIYMLQRLICQACKATFTATPPGEARDRSGVDPSAPEEAGSIKERVFAPSAAAQIASLRFEMGVPHFRLADIQAQQGSPLAPSTQYKVMDSALREPATAVFGELVRLAGASGELFINDDTRARVMDLEQGVKKARETALAQALKNSDASTVNGAAKKPSRLKRTDAAGNNIPRQQMQTTAMIVHCCANTICLYWTGHGHAGDNLAKVLAHRSSTAPMPKQMCDGLRANLPKSFVTNLGNCLDHCRRKYNDVEAAFPLEVAYVLDALGKVYHQDDLAKAENLSPSARLAWHQEHSAPIMAALAAWAATEIAEKRVEPNSTLGKAIEYMQKRWKQLTAFLRVEGMPLSSAEVERLIKRCIRHRKNSMHYKTQRGAELGDMIMSLAQTCRYAKKSTHDYLTAIATHAERVTKAPANWLPWNYQLALNGSS